MRLHFLRTSGALYISAFKWPHREHNKELNPENVLATEQDTF